MKERSLRRFYEYIPDPFQRGLDRRGALWSKNPSSELGQCVPPGPAHQRKRESSDFSVGQGSLGGI